MGGLPRRGGADDVADLDTGKDTAAVGAKGDHSVDAALLATPAGDLVDAEDSIGDLRDDSVSICLSAGHRPFGCFFGGLT